SDRLQHEARLRVEPELEVSRPSAAADVMCSAPDDRRVGKDLSAVLREVVLRDDGPRWKRRGGAQLGEDERGVVITIGARQSRVELEPPVSPGDAQVTAVPDEEAPGTGHRVEGRVRRERVPQHVSAPT